jgi:hypothetical protein
VRSKRRIDRIILGEASENFREPNQDTSASVDVGAVNLYDGISSLRNSNPDSNTQENGRPVETYENDAESTSSTVSSITFNESLFFRSDRDFDAMERMDEALGAFQEFDDEEEIIFEHDAAIDTNYGENVQSELLIARDTSNHRCLDRSNLVTTDTESLFVDVKLVDSPQSQDDNLSQADNAFLGTSPVSWMAGHVLKGVSKRDGVHSYVYKSDSGSSSSKTLSRPYAKRRRCGFLVCLALLIVLAVGISGARLLAITAGHPEKALEDAREIPSGSNTTESLRLLFASISGIENLDDPTKPQFQTLEWLLHDDAVLSNLSGLNYNTLVERYVVSLLYFSLKGETWDEQNNFLSPSHICRWTSQTSESTGVICDSESRVTHLLLGKRCS